MTKRNDTLPSTDTVLLPDPLSASAFATTQDILNQKIREKIDSSEIESKSFDYEGVQRIFRRIERKFSIFVLAIIDLES